MVTYDEYLSYFERFIRQLNNIPAVYPVIHYLIDSIIISNFTYCSESTYIKLEKNEEIKEDPCVYRSYGNNIHHVAFHLISEYNPRNKGQHLNISGYWRHGLPKIDLKSIRFSAIQCSKNEFLLLFRRIYDDYRMRTETFPIYDLQIKYLSFVNRQ